MTATVRCVLVVSLLAAIVVVSWAPVVPAQAPDQPKADERLARMENRLEQIEKMLLDVQATLRDKPLPATLTDEGEVLVLGRRENDKDGEAEVYYRLPFATPPKITIITSLYGQYVLAEQKADHFKIKNTSTASDKIRWKAEGMPARDKAK